MTKRRPNASRASRMRLSSSWSFRRVNRSGRIVCSIELSILAQPKVSLFALRYEQGGETKTMSAVLDYKRRIYAIRDLPTLPVIARKVMTLADDDTAGPQKPPAIILTDQALSAWGFCLAQFPHHRHPPEISTTQPHHGPF